MRYQFRPKIGASRLLFCGTCLLVLVSGAQAQKTTPPTEAGASPTVRGVVLERETKQPITDAEILLYSQQAGPVLLNGGWKLETLKARTDQNGSFVLDLSRAGKYRVQARRSGYSSTNELDLADLTIEAGRPAPEVTLFLSGVGSITGTVIDEETGKPLRNVPLTARRAIRRGLYWPNTSAPAITDNEGRFSLSELPPGRYLVEIGGKMTDRKRVLTEFTPKDIKTVDRDYEHTWWPGGSGQEAAMAVTVDPGSSLDIGRLSAREVPYYRVLVRLPASDCAAGDTIQISESSLSGGGLTVQGIGKEVPCGKDVLITGFRPGSSRLLIYVNGRTKESRGAASIQVSIADENIEAISSLTPGVTLDGRFVMAEGARAPYYAKLKLFLRAVDGVGFPDQDIPTPDSDGKFQFTNVRMVGHTMTLSGLGTAHYVKEIRYNGSVLPDNLIPLDRVELANTLTIVVDDKPGTITGSVRRDGQPVRQPLCDRDAVAQGESWSRIRSG